MQAVPVFPDESYLGDDRPTYKEGDEQSRGYMKDDPVGYWAQPDQHRVPP